MDRLALYLIILSGSAIAGALIIAGFSMGYYTVWTVVIGAVLGFAMAVPTGYMVARAIKRNDPNWNADRNRPDSTPGNPDDPAA